ncbi:MAG TPA: LytTR family DNA-binding domain-containing protein [Polyangiaceae bacterium]|nr:LytTR family DNA-binding domain-containing protein [Polyangiaceae bacterium]
MGPLRALIVEDEAPARNYLSELLFASRRATVVGAVATAREASQVVAEARDELDVVFVDVRLLGDRDESGLELARDLTARGLRCVFTTASREFAAAAFDLGAADYLLKPFHEERLERCLQRLLATHAPAPHREPPRLVARRRRGWVFLRADDVWAFEAAERLTFVHTPLGRHDMDLSLTALESAFEGRLLRPHRNWLAHLPHVHALEREGAEAALLLGPPDARGAHPLRVPVARERLAAVKSALLGGAPWLRP